MNIQGMAVGEVGGVSGGEWDSVGNVGCMIHMEGSKVKLATAGDLSAVDSVFDSVGRLPV